MHAKDARVTFTGLSDRAVITTFVAAFGLLVLVAVFNHVRQPDPQSGLEELSFPLAWEDFIELNDGTLVYSVGKDGHTLACADGRAVREHLSRHGGFPRSA